MHHHIYQKDVFCIMETIEIKQVLTDKNAVFYFALRGKKVIGC